MSFIGHRSFRLPTAILIFSAFVSFSFILINRRWLLVCAACSRILSDRLAIYVLIPEKYFAPRSQILSDLLAIYVLIPENTYLKAWPWNLSKVCSRIWSIFVLCMFYIFWWCCCICRFIDLMRISYRGW